MEKHLQPDYLDLLEKTLLHWFWEEPQMGMHGEIGMEDKEGPAKVWPSGSWTIENRYRIRNISLEEKESGSVAWPLKSFTMVNRIRLRNVRDLIQRVVKENVPGDFVECGVWRGGVCIYARACLPPNRLVHACDSFCGFPDSETEQHWKSYWCLKVTQAEVVQNFEKFGLNHGVNFVTGFFEDTLPRLDVKIAVLRFDSDSLRNTKQIMESLWPRLSLGGYVIHDEGGECAWVREEIERQLGYTPNYHHPDRVSIWFQKEKP